MLKDGVIAQQGSPKELCAFPNSEFLADFIGNSNIVPGNITAIDNDKATVDIDGLQLRLPHRNSVEGDIKLSVHPRSINIEEGNGIPATLKGNVTKATYLGGHMEYLLDCPIGELFVVDYRIDKPINKGADVAISFDESGVSLIPNS